MQRSKAVENRKKKEARIQQWQNDAIKRNPLQAVFEANHPPPFKSQRTNEVYHKYALENPQPVSKEVFVTVPTRSYPIPASRPRRQQPPFIDEVAVTRPPEHKWYYADFTFADCKNLMADPEREARLQSLSQNYWSDRLARSAIKAEDPLDQKQNEANKVPDLDDNTEDDIVDWVWQQMAPNSDGLVTKEQTVRYLSTQPELRQAFQLEESQYVRVVYSMVTSVPGYLTRQDFDVLLTYGTDWTYNRAMAVDSSLVRPEVSEWLQFDLGKEQNRQLVADKIWKAVEDTYERLLYEAGCEEDNIDTLALIAALEKDSDLCSYLDQVVIVVGSCHITLRTVIEELKFMARRQVKKNEKVAISKKMLESLFSSSKIETDQSQYSANVVDRRIKQLFDKAKDKYGLVDASYFFSLLQTDEVLCNRQTMNAVANQSAAMYFRQLSLSDTFEAASKSVPTVINFSQLKSALRRVQIDVDYLKENNYSDKEIKGLIEEYSNFKGESLFPLSSHNISIKEVLPSLKIPQIPSLNLKKTTSTDKTPQSQGRKAYGKGKPQVSLSDLGKPLLVLNPVSTPKSMVDGIATGNSGLDLGLENLIKDVFSHRETMWKEFVEADRRKLSSNISKRLSAAIQPSQALQEHRSKEKKVREASESLENLGTVEITRRLSSHRSGTSSNLKISHEDLRAQKSNKRSDK